MPTNQPRDYLSPIEIGSADLDQMLYKDLEALLKQGATDKNGKINPHILNDNLNLLANATTSPRVISFLWLCTSGILRRSDFRLRDTSKIFSEFWKKHNQSVKDFLADAPLEFLSINSKYANESLLETNNLHRIISERLVAIRATTTTDDAEHIMRVYRSLRLMPPPELITDIPPISIDSHSDLVKYVNLLHGISRSGLSIANSELLDPIQNLNAQQIAQLLHYDHNNLLWSLTAQFAFAHDGEIEMASSLQQSYQRLLNIFRSYTPNNNALKRTFNLASIVLGNNSSHIQYDDEDKSSHSEYKFMHDFREHALTNDERANLKRADITKHVARLGRAVDGHYMINGRPVIIEFDGKSHYRESANDFSDEPNGSTKLQTHILRKLFPDNTIIRLHYKLGNEFSSQRDEQKPAVFGKFREVIESLPVDAHYIDLHNGKLRTQSARELQQRHNNEYGITRQPTQM